MQQITYPVQFSIDSPDRTLDCVSSAFRIFAAIRSSSVLGTVAGGPWQWSHENGRGRAWPRGQAAGCSSDRCS